MGSVGCWRPTGTTTDRGTSKVRRLALSAAGFDADPRFGTLIFVCREQSAIAMREPVTATSSIATRQCAGATAPTTERKKIANSCLRSDTSLSVTRKRTCRELSPKCVPVSSMSVRLRCLLCLPHRLEKAACEQRPYLHRCYYQPAAASVRTVATDGRGIPESGAGRHDD